MNSFKVVVGGLLGGFITIVMTYVIILLLFLPSEASRSFSLALYFTLASIVYLAPIGMVIGSLISAYRLRKKQQQDKNKQKQAILPVWIWQTIPIILFVILALSPYFLLNQTNNSIKHAAHWFLIDHPRCKFQAVVVVLIEFDDDDIVCSEEVLELLQNENIDVISITYRVTYDFFEPRSYQLIEVGNVEITWEQWFAGSVGCSIEYSNLPPCNDPVRQNESPLYESTWSE